MRKSQQFKKPVETYLPQAVEMAIKNKKIDQTLGDPIGCNLKLSLENGKYKPSREHKCPLPSL